jgi:hypothetical protein
MKLTKRQEEIIENFFSEMGAEDGYDLSANAEDLIKKLNAEPY